MDAPASLFVVLEDEEEEMMIVDSSSSSSSSSKFLVCFCVSGSIRCVNLQLQFKLLVCHRKVKAS